MHSGKVCWSSCAARRLSGSLARSISEALELITFAFKHSSFLKYFHIFCWILLVMKIAYIPSIIMCCCMHVEINIPILSSFAQKTLQKVRKNFREAFLSFGEVFPFCRCVYLKLHQTSGCLLSVLAHLISRRQNLRAKMSFL